MTEQIENPPSPEAPSHPPQKLNSINLSRKRGIPLYFRIYLPPNLADAAPQDAIIVKIEGKVKNSRPFPLEQLDRSRAFKLSPPHYQVAKLLEEWCNPPPFISLLQLTRRRLLVLINALKGQPSVFKPDLQEEALEWVGDVIPGVHEHLVTDNADDESDASKSRINDVLSVDDETFRPMIIDGSTQYISIELPSRNNPFYQQTLDLVKSEGFVLEPANRKWWIRDRHKTLNFLACHWKDLKKNYNAQFTKNFLKRTASLRFVKIKCKATEGNDDFTINLKLETYGADDNNLRQNLARGQYYLQSPKGFVLLQPKVIEKLTQAQRSLSGEPDRSLAPSYYQKLIPPQLIDAENLLEGIVDTISAPESWKKKSRCLKDLSRLEPAPILPELDERLRGYQKIGTAWMWNMYKNDLGGILADEMGLGKTVQALAFLQCVLDEPPSEDSKCLVVCPASLVENWRREANMFIPHVKVFCHQGAARLKTVSQFNRYQLIITSYTTLARDQDLFNQMTFSAIVGDEAQHIKNKQTQNARALKSLQTKGRILLTGTPLENSINDLRSLFDFLMPGYLVNPPSSLTLEERNWYNSRLKEQASPYILRRSKAVVAPELPDKIEQILYCEMDETQAEEYKRLQEQTQKTISEMELAGKNENQIRLAALNQLLRLRQVCADPRILNESLAAENSAKFRVFKEVLQESIDSNHRILVFSQFVSVLQLLKKELDEMEIPYCYLDGKTTNRLDVCDQFNNTPSIPVFLISLKAGGVGLNLTGADTVIHFDPWWNPAVEDQATDRAHRIGQTKVVSSIKLIVAGSVEEKVLELQNSKSELLKDLLEASEAANAKISLKEIKELIR